LEGSVRKAGDKVRINAQLIDATTGGHLWAERYDRDYKDIFALQDEVIQQIVSALSVKFKGTEKDRVGTQKSVNLVAYDYYLRGKQILYNFTVKDLYKSKSMFKIAIDLDPNFAHAYAAHAMADYSIWRFGKIQESYDKYASNRKRAFEYVNKAIELDPNLSSTYSVLGSLEILLRNYDKAIADARKAVVLDPNDPEGYVHLSYILTKAGEHEKGLETIQKAFKLNPIPPKYYYLYLSSIQVNNRQYKMAIESIKKGGFEPPAAWRHELLVSYFHLGQMDKAQEQLEVILKHNPHQTIEGIKRIQAFKERADEEHWIEAYQKLGLKNQFAFKYEGDENNILSKDEITNLIIDRTITGIFPPEGRWWMHHSKDGQYRISGAWEFSGKYWFEGNKLYRTISYSPGDIVQILFYRNPEGSPKEMNEYHLFFPVVGEIYPFSVEK
jgi:tetratricopeptide (TPR) repeat protein